MIGELGVVDTAAYIAASAALTALAKKMVTDAAKSGFTALVSKAVPKAALAPAAAAAAAHRAQEAAAARPAEPVTPEEVREEVETIQEEAAEQVAEEALEGAGFLGKPEDIVKASLAPALMPPNVARRAAQAASDLVCSLEPAALRRIGGEQAVSVGMSMCRAQRTGDAGTLKFLLPQAVQIAAKAAEAAVATAIPQGTPSVATTAGAFGAAGEVASRYLFASMRDQATGLPVYVDRSMRAAQARRVVLQRRHREWGVSQSRIAALATSPGRLKGIAPADLGLLAALATASPEELAVGLSGVDPAELGAIRIAPDMLAMIPAAIAVFAGAWMAYRS
jgi:hypothetical protein